MADECRNLAAPAPVSSAADELSVLREEVGSLVKTIQGPVASVALRRGECSLEITWSHPVSFHAQTPVPGKIAAGGATTEAVVPNAATAAVTPEPDDPAVQDVPAPLVGTFYSAPEPGVAAYVEVGDHIEAGAPIGIIEAMKLMNPVIVPKTGTVVEVLVADAEPVEYGRVLVRLRVDES